MTALLAFLRIAYPWLIGAGLGAWSAHELDQIPYSRLQTTLASERTQRADELAAAQKAAADALQAQINTRLTTEANNSNVIAQLTADRDSAASDRDFAKRLLAAAQAKPPARGSPVSPAGNQSGTADTAPASGDRSLAADLGDAAGECRDAIQRLAAIQVELVPQLKVPHVQ